MGKNRPGRKTSSGTLKKTVGFISLGCTKNLVDTEMMIGLLAPEHKIVSDLDQASLIIVNTCSFLQAARDEVFETLENLQKWRHSSPHHQILVTGCITSLSKTIQAPLKTLCDDILTIPEQTNIKHRAQNLLSLNAKVGRSMTKSAYDLHPQRILATPPHTAYLKIGDGCDNHCAYCLIPKIRGKATYKPSSLVLKEAQILAEKGVKELILIAQDTSAYQPINSYRLPDLLDDVKNIKKLEWIRLMYCYPEHITDRLVDSIANIDQVVKYIDMPIQHINDTILTKMNRHGKKATIRRIIEKLRNKIPGIKLRSTVMVGFPGESEKAFNELHDFIKDTEFDHLGAFAYSDEPGTASAKMRGKINDAEKISRLDRIMRTQKNISKKLNQAYLGQTMKILMDQQNGGRRFFDAPDIDGFVTVTNPQKAKPGTFQNVTIHRALEYDLEGVII